MFVCVGVCVTVIFFCHGQVSPNVTQYGNSNALWPGSGDLLPAGRVVFALLSVVCVVLAAFGKRSSLALSLSSNSRR